MSHLAVIAVVDFSACYQVFLMRLSNSWSRASPIKLLKISKRNRTSLFQMLKDGEQVGFQGIIASKIVSHQSDLNLVVTCVDEDISGWALICQSQCVVIYLYRDISLLHFTVIKRSSNMFGESQTRWRVSNAACCRLKSRCLVILNINFVSSTIFTITLVSLQL